MWLAKIDQDLSIVGSNFINRCNFWSASFVPSIFIIRFVLWSNFFPYAADITYYYLDGSLGNDRYQTPDSWKKYYNTELDVNKSDEGVLKDLLNEVTKSIDQSLKNLAIADKWVVWYLFAKYWTRPRLVQDKNTADLSFTIAWI